MITEEQFKDWKKRLKERFEELFNQNHLLNDVIDNISIHNPVPHRRECVGTKCQKRMPLSNVDKGTDGTADNDEPDKFAVCGNDSSGSSNLCKNCEYYKIENNKEVCTYEVIINLGGLEEIPKERTCEKFKPQGERL